MSAAFSAIAMKADVLERWPEPVDECAQTFLSAIRRIGRSYIEPFGEEIGGPTGANHPGTDDGDPARYWSQAHLQTPGNTRLNWASRVATSAWPSSAHR
jgi:hypothetical protein